MHTLIQLSVFWALAFMSLGVAIMSLGIFYSLIGDGLELHSFWKETVLAGVVSLIEAVSVWLILTYVPGAVRALFLPALAVALIYKIAHLEDWSRFEIFLLFIFQVFIVALGASLYFGQFQTALIILAAFAVILLIVGAFIRCFGD